MSTTVQKSFLKRHLFLVLFGGLIFLLLLLSGLLIAYYFNDIRYIQNFPKTNVYYFLFWRLFIYTALFISWKTVNCLFKQPI